MNANKNVFFATIALVLLAIACGIPASSPPAPTATPLSPTLTPAPTRPKPTPTLTNTPDVAILAGLTDAPNATATEEPASVPSSFTILLVFANDTTCGFDGFEFDYAVTLDGTTITLVQIVNGITSTGPYDPATGTFTAEVSGLPGTETYTGTITTSPDPDGGTVVSIVDGLYTYGNDPGISCQGYWPFTGTTTVP